MKLQLKLRGKFLPSSVQKNKSVPLCCILREAGLDYKSGSPAKGFQWAAEEKLISKNHEEFNCYLPDQTRSTFLMVFSPDGKLIASTHGNHNVYVTDLTNGKNVKTLTGHPRTPWCIAFHPSSNQILASGCLGGQVRVWDLHGGSEIWTADSQTVIASLAFHPTDRVLVIASYNEIHFWDWSQQKPFAKCCTSNEREKVRYVAFDGMGEKLVTGIANAPVRLQSQWDRVSAPQPPPQLSQQEHERRITICYRYMVEQYEQLVERYYRLSGQTNNQQQQLASTMRQPNTIDRGTDPMEPQEDRSNRCSLCRRSNSNGDAGPSTAGTSPHQHSADEANPPTAQEAPATTEQDQRTSSNLTLRVNYLYERLARLRSQVETGRNILARTRNAAAAMTARMSPSAPEDASYLIDSLQLRSSAANNPGRATVDGQMLMLPEPLVPTEPAEDRPSIISRIGSLLGRRRPGTDSSSSDTPSGPCQSQRLTNLTCPPTSRRVLFDPAPGDPPPTCNHDQPASTPPSSRSDPTNSDSELDGFGIRQHIAEDSTDSSISHWRVFLRYRYFRDSGSNTEPPSESNSSDSNSSFAFQWAGRLRRTCESSSAVARLRAQFRRLQSAYSTRDREPHLLRIAADNAERRLLLRLTNLLQRPFPSTGPDGFQPPPASSTDLASVRFGIQLLGRHIDALTRQCTQLRLESRDLRRMWDELESQIFTLQTAVREWPPAVVHVSPNNSVDAEGVASTSSLPTDEESEDCPASILGGPSHRRTQLATARRLRFLHRPVYKRPRFDSRFRFSRRYPHQQGASGDDDSDDDDSDDAEDEVVASKSRTQSDGSEEENNQPNGSLGSGVKRKFSQPPDAPRGYGPRVGPRFRVAVRGRFRSPLPFRPWQNPFRERGWSGMPMYREGSEDNISSRNRPGTSGTREANQREAIRHRARHVLLLMVDSLTQFFENDTFTRTASDDNLQERVTNLVNLLELALNLTDLLLTQLAIPRREGSGGRRNTEPSPPTPPSTTTASTCSRDLNSPEDHLMHNPLHNPYQPVRLSVAMALNQQRECSADRPRPTHGGRGSSSTGSRLTAVPCLPLLRVNDLPPPPDNHPPPVTLRESPPPLLLPPPPPFPFHHRSTPSSGGSGGSGGSSSNPPPNVSPTRFLHPRYRLPMFVDDSSEGDSSVDRNDLFFLRASSISMLSDTPMAPHHRIQAWDFTRYALPEIHLADKNIVVSECKIHNDASVDISSDGKLLVSLLPSGRLSITTMLGVYSLEWTSLGQCLYTTSFEQNAVSVSLSPTTKHLIVGLASRRVHFFHTDRQTIAQIFRLEGGQPSRTLPSKGRLVLVRELDMSRESTDFMSLNCIRWAPTPGEAFVYGTNTGKLKILR